MIAPALLLPLIGLLFGAFAGWAGLSLVRLITRYRSEGWFIAGAAVMVVLMLGLTCALALAVSVMINTVRIGMSQAETVGYLLCLCAFDAGALASMFGTLLAEVSGRRKAQGRAPLVLFSRAWFSAAAWGLD